jgi:hypothetical protein
LAAHGIVTVRDIVTAPPGHLSNVPGAGAAIAAVQLLKLTLHMTRGETLVWAYPNRHGYEIVDACLESGRPEDALAVPVAAFGLSHRTVKALNGIGVECLGELVRRPAADVYAAPLFGPKAGRELRKLLKDLGLGLGMDDAAVATWKEKAVAAAAAKPVWDPAWTRRA